MRRSPQRGRVETDTRTSLGRPLLLHPEESAVALEPARDASSEFSVLSSSNSPYRHFFRSLFGKTQRDVREDDEPTYFLCPYTQRCLAIQEACEKATEGRGGQVRRHPGPWWLSLGSDH